jgi:hypothetical protein
MIMLVHGSGYNKGYLQDWKVPNYLYPFCFCYTEKYDYVFLRNCSSTQVPTNLFLQEFCEFMNPRHPSNVSLSRFLSLNVIFINIMCM